MDANAAVWLLCSACKTEIPFRAVHWVCSVSTCNRSRTRLVFCSVPCWDSHVATLRHRDAWAEDKIAPSKAAWERELADQPAELPRISPQRTGGPPAPPARPVQASAPMPPAASAASAAPAAPAGSAAPAPRRIVGDAPPAPPGIALQEVADRDILIVVSKLKKYIKDRSGMNCSDAVAEVLSDHVRALADDSIRAAGRDERKTVLDRDVPRPRR